MKFQSGVLEFDWDEGNLDKSRRKHEITPEEAETVFFDEKSLVIPDTFHSEIEKRLVIIGQSNKQRYLFVVFTLRQGKIRIISARRMHKEEVAKYGKS